MNGGILLQKKNLLVIGGTETHVFEVTSASALLTTKITIKVFFCKVNLVPLFYKIICKMLTECIKKQTVCKQFSFTKSALELSLEDLILKFLNCIT